MLAQEPKADASKSRFELCSDVYSHTNARVKANQEKLVQLFNERPQFKLHYTDKEVRKITEESIAFPIGYKALKSVMEQNLDTIKQKHLQKILAERMMEEKHIVLRDYTPQNELANVLGDALKLAKLKNCYTNYKKLGKNNAETFLMHKYNGKLLMEDKCEKLMVELQQKMGDERKKQREEKLQKI